MNRSERSSGRARVANLLIAAAVLSMLPVLAQAAPPPRYEFNCPVAGQVMVGIEGWQGWWMDGIRTICANVDVTSGAIGGNVRMTPVAGTQKGTIRT